MILDATAPLLYWEQLNHTLLKKYNWGYQLTHIENLNGLVANIFQNPEYANGILQRLTGYPKKRLDMELKNILKEILK